MLKITITTHNSNAFHKIQQNTIAQQPPTAWRVSLIRYLVRTRSLGLLHRDKNLSFFLSFFVSLIRSLLFSLPLGLPLPLLPFPGSLSPFVWLIDWLVDWMDEWMTVWLVGWLGDWLIDWLFGCLTNGLLDWLLVSLLFSIFLIY